MSSPFKAPEFKTLFQEWNKILELSGHEEIEDFNLPDPPLKVWHSLKWQVRVTPEEMKRVQAYYDKAQELLLRFKFKCEAHRQVWALHCKGLSVRQIAQRLNRKDLSKSPVHQIIVQIQTETGLKLERS